MIVHYLDMVSVERINVNNFNPKCHKYIAIKIKNSLTLQVEEVEYFIICLN
jgi:hypothetical protein